MTLQLDLPPDIEARYIAEARARGVSLEKQLNDWLVENAPPTREDRKSARSLNLPTMKGTIIGSLRRRDIYDDRG